MKRFALALALTVLACGCCCSHSHAGGVGLYFVRGGVVSYPAVYAAPAAVGPAAAYYGPYTAYAAAYPLVRPHAVYYVPGPAYAAPVAPAAPPAPDGADLAAQVKSLTVILQKQNAAEERLRLIEQWINSQQPAQAAPSIKIKPLPQQ
jgi:hypothetical protein